MVLYLFTGTGPTAKASLQKPRHFNFTGCDADSEFVIKMVPSLLRVFAKQVLPSESDITECRGVQKAAKQYQSQRKAGSVVHRQGARKVLKKLCPVQVFAEHIPAFLGECHMDIEMFEKARHMICTQWSEKWLALLKSKAEQALLAQKCFLYGKSIKRSLVNHLSPDMGCFASKAFTEGETDGYNYGKLEYKIMSAHGIMQYGGSVMSDSPSAFREYSIQLKRK